MPGLEHEVSQMTKRTDADPYGCHNGERGKYHVAVQDGWSAAGQRYMVAIPFRMSVECRYDQSLTDKRCKDCRHAGSGEEYDQMVRSKGK